MTTETPAPPALPLAGLRVIDFTHMILGPSMGMILGDLGADVIKVEPPAGDNTRRLVGSGAGFFAYFNRNKKSLAVDTKSPRGKEILLRLIGTADVFSENFKPGAMVKMGLDYATLAKINPRLIYVSHKGFLPGPYENRTALDEVVQMMGGLAYMTGPVGQPVRAGTSVNDIMGGMFGVIGVLSALLQRQTTGKGSEVKTALFENNVMLVAQHMVQFAITGQSPAPMPSRINAWGLYDTFVVKDGAQIFLGVVTDSQWATFCDAFGFADLKADARLKTNVDRVQSREWMLPEVRRRLVDVSAEHLAVTFEKNGLPYAPITKPEALFDDPHLRATGGLAPVTIAPTASYLNTTVETEMPLLPLTIGGQRFPIRMGPPGIGVDTGDLLAGLGYTAAEIAALTADGVVVQG